MQLSGIYSALNMPSERQTFALFMNLNTARERTVQLFIPFAADEMIVRQVSYKHDSAENDQVNFLYCDLVNQYIAVFSDQCENAPGSTFNIKRPVSGNAVFRVTSDNAGTASTAAGRLGVILEFVKHPSKK